jgi:hypothetical protein
MSCSTLLERLMKIKFDFSLRSKWWRDGLPRSIARSVVCFYPGTRKVAMSTYRELLQSAPKGRKDCGLGRILETEGQEKHDAVLNVMFERDEDGQLFSCRKLANLFDEEYGWSEFFFRRHRNGKCVSCLNRT